MNAMRITGTFIDEISHDIPHQNWGPAEWEKDFQYMKTAGINTVIMIRCGYRKYLTYHSDYLLKKYHCHEPPVDLLELFLSLADKHQMDFYFGLYDSGRYWDTGDVLAEIEDNKFVTEEAWQRYGHHPSFKGWYLSMEISRKTKGAIRAFQSMGTHCKEISNTLPVLISPWIDGHKAVLASAGMLRKDEAITLKEHENEWNEILDGIKDAIDIIAFQDGHVFIHELYDFLLINKQLAEKYHLTSWSNCESFDRDMPIKFLPIKFEKLLLKLAAAEKAGYSRTITFEFSHFMSPQSMYVSAHHLYNRYLEFINNKT
jgi:hypothetical protein